ncbi:Unknown protein [Striga hermonthica]|uniref:Uncharacterized protein n=1 Tax=Striga hermonthica TaxID=68872 RepID=A0A9N7NZX5_STRHE|nr:Unknown protein [Striga hermonthica]
MEQNSVQTTPITMEQNSAHTTPTTMERELDEMQYMGVIGIYKESFKLIFNLRKIFARITLTLILPLSIIFLAQKHVSDLLYHKIHFFHNLGLPAYIALHLLYFILTLLFSLPSTSAVIYTVACHYASLDLSFKKITRAVPRVLTRLAVAFVCVVLALAAYNIPFGALYYVCWGRPIFMFILVMHTMGVVQLIVTCQLAVVVSVLEDRGFGALGKGNRLTEWRMLELCYVLGVVDAAILGVNVGFMFLVMWGGSRHVAMEVGLGAVCVVVVTLAILLGVVAQTVAYFVCKADKEESVDRAVLAERLGKYEGSSAVPKDDVQTEEGYRV